ncbi:hypothetical protein Nm8I071_35570 [Nonomuraea sp. TT08I-71]|nr:hypothetical protein Nm8I071_35570 [Nonomuraea sp. TT08I-71]
MVVPGFAVSLSQRKLRCTWSALADRILADAAVHGLAADGHWRRAYDDDLVDSALLLPGSRGGLRLRIPAPIGLPGRSSRSWRRTATCIGSGLTAALGDAEGAFLLCGFAAALAARQAGDAVGASRWFERNRAACGPPGLYTEEHDVRRRQLRGNVLQGFVHALMLETAVTPGQVDPCR